MTEPVEALDADEESGKAEADCIVSHPSERHLGRNGKRLRDGLMGKPAACQVADPTADKREVECGNAQSVQKHLCRIFRLRFLAVSAPRLQRLAVLARNVAMVSLHQHGQARPQAHFLVDII